MYYLRKQQQQQQQYQRRTWCNRVCVAGLLAATSSTTTMAFTTPAIPLFSRTNQLSMSSPSTVSKSTGPAKNFEEDLQLTLAIILDHVARSTTVGKEQFLQQIEEQAAIPTDLHYDVSIPYHASAELAYEQSAKDVSLDDFIIQFEQQAVADVIAKRLPAPVVEEVVAPVAEPEVIVDVSVPYDAAALLAYEQTDKSVSFDDYKIQYYEQAVADVIAKRTPVPVAAPVATTKPEVVVDVSVPYDAAALLAYDKTDKSVSFDDYKIQYYEQSVADVIAKRAPAAPVAAAPAVVATEPELVVDISVPYDAAALLAYETTDKSVLFDEYKIQYYKQAVADVIAKRSPPAPVTAVEAAPVPAVEEPAAVDVSVPYDATARLAYEKTDQSVPFTDFEIEYYKQAVADVIAKRNPAPAAAVAAPLAANAATEVDLSVPYDAAALLAYEKTDKSIPFDEYKIQYYEQAVADVIAKRK